MLKQTLNLENINDKIKFLNEIANILSKVSNNIERELYIEKLSKEYGVSKESIYAEVNKLMYARNSGSKTLEKPKLKSELKKEITEVDEITQKRENMILYLLINYPLESYKKIKSMISQDDFKVDSNKIILAKLYEEIEKGNINNDVLNYFEDESIINHITEIMSIEMEINDVNKCIDDILIAYEKEKLINRRKEIIEKLKDSKNMDKTELDRLEDELSNILIKLNKSK